MKIDLSEKTAIVTGSTGGIGFAIAKGLAHAGAAVVLNGRQRKAVDEAISKLKGTNTNAPVRGVAADLGTAQGCAAVVQAKPSTDILVNNVGTLARRTSLKPQMRSGSTFLLSMSCRALGQERIL